jgi:hypothetical protein
MFNYIHVICENLKFIKSKGEKQSNNQTKDAPSFARGRVAWLQIIAEYTALATSDIYFKNNVETDGKKKNRRLRSRSKIKITKFSCGLIMFTIWQQCMNETSFRLQRQSKRKQRIPEKFFDKQKWLVKANRFVYFLFKSHFQTFLKVLIRILNLVILLLERTGEGT